MQIPQNASPASIVKLDQAAKVETHADSVAHGLEKSLSQTKPNIAWNVTAGKIVWSIIVFVLALFFIRFTSRLLEAVAERWTNLRLFIKGVVPIIRIAGWTVVIYIIVIGIYAPPIATLITATASLGIALGFASQDILKNIFGGIMILFDRPFQVGDKIEVGKHYGEVVQIGLRTVRIVTPDDSIVSIPNSEIMSQSVSNSNTGRFNQQVVSEFYVPPGVDIPKLKDICYQAAAVSRYVYLDKPIAVVIKNEIFQGRSLLKVRLKAYVFDLRYEFAFSTEMTEIVMNELLSKGLVSAKDLALLSN
jgi:small-conductance mechanosensitive channel